jgi:two-component system chemotaxis response regulator CheY
MVRILAIDDSKAVHAYLDVCLKGTDALIKHCFNGKEGFETLKANPENFDIVFLDWEMPIMDGPTTVTQIKEHGLQTPIVMMTTKNAPEDIMRMLEKGVSDYMLKPFTGDIILGKILQCCGMEVKNAA